MKLKEFLENINKMVQDNPEILELTVVSSKDDEGNEFNKVHYNPAIGYFIEEDLEFISADQFEDFGDESEELIINSICIN